MVMDFYIYLHCVFEKILYNFNSIISLCDSLCLVYYACQLLWLFAFVCPCTNVLVIWPKVPDEKLIILSSERN